MKKEKDTFANTCENVQHKKAYQLRNENCLFLCYHFKFLGE